MSDDLLSPESRARIEAALGRTLDPAEAGSVESFAAFKDRDIAELRRVLRELNSVYAILFTLYKLKGRTPLQHAVQFYEAVLVRGEPPMQWRPWS